MSDFSSIDSNFKIETTIGKDDIKFYDVRNAPFEIHGVYYDEGKFRRMPENIASTVSDAVHKLHANTAGGRIRFRTDSPYVAIYAKMPTICRMPHFALTGSAGFDLYAGSEEYRYIKTFVPPYDFQDGYESLITFPTAESREIMINMPLYSDVSELYIGLQENAQVTPPKPYKIQKPVVFYGSSITQGGCASRPGTSYESILSRMLDADYINLGFSGNAKAEEAIANYIKTLDMSVFVYDYDHNAPTNDFLAQTHERMFRIIREANPELPIVLASRPKFTLSKSDIGRVEIIKTTYNHAKEQGDEHVYFVHGTDLMRLAGNEGTVDATHPNDLGFMSMAQGFEPVLREILY